MVFNGGHNAKQNVAIHILAFCKDDCFALTLSDWDCWSTVGDGTTNDSIIAQE